MAQIGSTIDVQSLVAELMKVQRVKLTRMQRTEALEKSKKDFYADITTKLESLKSKIEGIGTSFNTVSYKIASDNESVVTAKVTSNAAVSEMTHVIKVDQLAKAEVVGANTLQTSKTDSLSLSGTLTFTVDGESFNVTIDSVDSLSKIRDRINEATDNVGVSASIVASTVGGEDRYSLVIASRETGLDNKVTISGDLASSFDFTNTISSAQDAEFTLDGASVVRSKNEIDDVIDGITFNLLGTDSNNVNLQVSKFNDDIHASVTTAIKDMVVEYNGLIKHIDSGLASHLLNDSTAKMVKLKIRDLMTASYGSGSLTHLLDMGVKLGEPVEIPAGDTEPYVSVGNMEVDETVLSEALSSQLNDIRDFFTNGTDSFNTVALAEIEDLLKVGGTIPERTKSISEEISRIGRDIDKELTHLDQVQQDLTLKYAALNSLLDRYNSISGFLDMQFSSMNQHKK